MNEDKQKFLKHNVLEFRYLALAGKDYDGSADLAEATADNLPDLLGDHATTSEMPLSIAVRYADRPDETYYETECAQNGHIYFDLSKLVQDGSTNTNEAQPQLVIKRERDIRAGDSGASEATLSAEDINSEGPEVRTVGLKDKQGKPTCTAFFSFVFHSMLPKTTPSLDEMFNQTLVELQDLRILRADRIALKHQSIKNTKTQIREFIVSLTMLNQAIEFNMESPEADSKKGRPRNSALFFLNDKNVSISIVEKQFRLEFDEDAMLATMRDGLEASNSRAFDSIKKKKVQTNRDS